MRVPTVKINSSIYSSNVSMLQHNGHKAHTNLLGGWVTHAIKKKSMATIESKHEISKHAIDTCTGILKNLLFPSIHILLVMPTWFQVCLLNQNWSWTRNDNWGNGSLWPTTLDALRSYKRPKTKLGAFKWYNPGTHITGWWFQSPWKILVNWDNYSQHMEK